MMHPDYLNAYRPGAYGTYRQIILITIPAILLNAAIPATTTIQTSLLGHLPGTNKNQLAAFAACLPFITFPVSFFNFLVDGVSAKVGQAVGDKNWTSVATNVKLTALFASLFGVLAAGLLLLCRTAIQGLLHLETDVRLYADEYWWIRCFVVPLSMWAMGMSSILQGYNRVGVSAVISVGQAIAEMAASIVLLRTNLFSQYSNLMGMGYVTFGTTAVSAMCSTLAVLTLRPHGAPAYFCLFGNLKQKSQTALQAEDESTLDSPLLASSDGGYEEVFNILGSAGRLRGQFSEPVFYDALGTPLSSSPQTPNDENGGEPFQGQASNTVYYDAVENRCTYSSDAEHDQEVSVPSAHLWWRELGTFLTDGCNMLIRSAAVQMTFIVGVICASHLGTSALAAHQVISQLWLLTSYVVDGFAAAGTVLGIRLGAMRNQTVALRDLKLLCRRVSIMGLMTGLFSSTMLWFLQDQVSDFFTNDLDTKRELGASVWLVICLAQPLNAGVFVFDGLLYASQAFAFVRSQMVLGLLCIFTPVLAISMHKDGSLAKIWTAKAFLNSWRFLTATYYIHYEFLQQPTAR